MYSKDGWVWLLGPLGHSMKGSLNVCNIVLNILEVSGLAGAEGGGGNCWVNLGELVESHQSFLQVRCGPNLQEAGEGTGEERKMEEETKRGRRGRPVSSDMKPKPQLSCLNKPRRAAPDED